MNNRTTSSERSEKVVEMLTQRMTQLARTLTAYVQAEPRPLQDLEEQVVQVLHDLGSLVLSALVPLAAPARPAAELPCPCGQLMRLQRQRPATVTTLLGSLSFTRAIYQCPSCGQRQAPLDSQLQIAAGGLSAGLSEVLALLGATQDSFAQASSVLERLCLVQLCPNSARAACEDLGSLLAEHTQQVVATAQQTNSAPAAAPTPPPRLYVSLDGVLTHTHPAGFKEIKTGCIYTTRSRRSRKQPEQVSLRAERQSYVAALTDAERFDWLLWAEACRRGMSSSSEVVVLGDGAHWIWNLASTHFPNAIQILDWYHSSEYVWNAATALYGEESDSRSNWAKKQLEQLWNGEVEQVVATLEASGSKAQAVSDAISYYRTHRERMDYPRYRAQGLQIGSGTIESACKQLVSARLKLAGMIWNADGAEAVAVVRAWLKSERWDEAMALRPPPQRSYQRRAVSPAPAAVFA